MTVILAALVSAAQPVSARWMQLDQPNEAAWRFPLSEQGKILFQATEPPPTTQEPDAPVSGEATVTATLSLATAAPDGSIIHVVQPGETFVSIAEAYNVNLLELLSRNGLTQDSIIYPGDQLVIHEADRTPTLPPTDTSTPRPPTATRRPTYTPRPSRTPTVEGLAGASETGTPEGGAVTGLSLQSVGSDPLLLAVFILGGLGLVMIVVGSLFKQRPGGE